MFDEIFFQAYTYWVNSPTGKYIMKLREWMDKTDIDVFEAARAFGVSIYAVKKWLTGERIPRDAMKARIKRVTKGQITGDDWVPKE